MAWSLNIFKTYFLPASFNLSRHLIYAIIISVNGADLQCMTEVVNQMHFYVPAVMFHNQVLHNRSYYGISFTHW